MVLLLEISPVLEEQTAIYQEVLDQMEHSALQQVWAFALTGQSLHQQEIRVFPVAVLAHATLHAITVVLLVDKHVPVVLFPIQMAVYVLVDALIKALYQPVTETVLLHLNNHFHVL